MGTQRQKLFRNAGRSALVVQPPEQGWVSNKYHPTGMQAAYIPCEIAYNRFENGAISSYDTGVVYLWGASMGNGIRKTRFHNNSVSLDCNVPNNSILSLIYYDNKVNGIENYNNLVFSKEGEFRTRYGPYNAYGVWDYKYFIARHENSVFIQPNANASAEVTSDILHADCLVIQADSIDDIPESEYPDGEYFHTGLK